MVLQKNNKEQHIISRTTTRDYEFGFSSNIQTTKAEKGLTEKTIRYISEQNSESSELLKWRLEAFRHWKTLQEPHWANIDYLPISYQDISYHAATTKIKSSNNIDPEIQKTFDKLGIPLQEQQALSGIAVDAILDSESIITTFKETLAKQGIIFCSISEALQKHPKLVKRYLGSVVPYTDNFYAALNSAVFSDGSFVYIPKGIQCPMDLSTYFRMNAQGTGQFERTLIIADEGSSVNYLEGCTAPIRKENQLHAAVVEIIAHKHARVHYSTVQNWYPGNKQGQGGVYNFVTKRGICKGEGAHISWTQVETGSAKTWKYPSVILQGNNSIGEFRSISVTTNHQQADTGTKMIHIGKNTKSTTISKNISADKSTSTYRGLVQIHPKAAHARNYTQCDSLLLGNNCHANTFPTIISKNATAETEHEATASKISEQQLFYCLQRGIPNEEAIGLIVNGFAKNIINHLPLEFAVEAQKLLGLSIENSIG